MTNLKVLYNKLNINILPPPFSHPFELSGINKSGATSALLTKVLHLVGRAFLCLCLDVNDNDKANHARKYEKEKRIYDFAA